MRIPIDIPAGLDSDDTTFAASPAWADACNVRFRLGRPQTIGGWEKLTLSQLSGVCRGALAWSDNAGKLTLAFGTHSNLQLAQGGGFYDITPFGPATLLAADPLTVTNGSATMSVSQTAHGLSTGQSVALSGARSVGRVTPNGTYAVTVLNANAYTVSLGASAVVSKTLGAGPLSVTSGLATVTVNEPSHNIASGTTVTISGAVAVGGITPNGAFPVSVIDANTYSFSYTAPATSTAAGGGSAVVAAVPGTGGGGNAVAVPQTLLPAGAVNGTGQSGYGSGAYGVGGYGQPSTAEYFPRSWSLAAWGQKLLASPRGGGLYAWSNNTAAPAVAVTSAPPQMTAMLAAPQRQVFALGCTQENGTYNPLCLRHSGVEDETEWLTDASSSSTAREYVLPGGGRIVSGRIVGQYLLVWTTQSLFLGTYVGQVSQVWRFDKVGDRCGLIAPGAAAVLGSSAFWITPDLQFLSYSLGGSVAPVECPIRDDFALHLTPSQADKICASTIAQYNEVRWDYPDQREGLENSRYLTLAAAGEDAGKWSAGRPMNAVRPARTTLVDAGPAPYPVGVSSDGWIYWHEKGATADGGALPWMIESADFYLDPGVETLVTEAWPDIGDDQIGPVLLTLTTRPFPQAAETTFGPFAIAPGQSTVSFKSAGRLFRIAYSGFSSPAYARLGRPVFDAKARGRRA